ncbi:MAG TPA: APC family permease [Pyrinomonadaceae bacterium]|nr:APC family permease [Pyrinomonadaceae bacterium]
MTKSTSRSATRARLLRVLGLGFGLAVIIGNTIGSGIFRTPGQIAAQLPNVWLYLSVWVIGGLYALLGATQIAELGTTLPQSGGQYVFARHALGEYAGFVVGWSDWISTCGSAAAVAIVIGEFSTALFPALHSAQIWIAVSITVAFGLLQWRGISWGSQSQNVTSALKAIAFAALIAACFIVGPNARASTAATVTPAGFALFAAFVISLQAVIFTYDGWTGVIYFSEEVERPERNIPRSLFVGLASIIAIYLLVNIALLYLVPISRIAGQDFAVGLAATELVGRYGDSVFRCLTIVSMLSALNAYHLMASRVLFAMSRDGLFMRQGADVNSGGTPVVALFISVAVAMLFIIFGQTFEQVLAVLAFFFVANYTLSFISVFVMRRREPARDRPYRAWGYPWTTALALLGSVIFLAGAIAGDTRRSAYAVLLLAISYPAFRLIQRHI